MADIKQPQQHFGFCRTFTGAAVAPGFLHPNSGAAAFGGPGLGGVQRSCPSLIGTRCIQAARSVQGPASAMTMTMHVVVGCVDVLCYHCQLAVNLSKLLPNGDDLKVNVSAMEMFCNEINH